MTLLMSLDLVLVLVLVGGIILSILLLLLVGTYIVKKGCVIIIEKYDEFYKICPKGWYFFLPVKYRRVGYYRIEEQTRVITLGNQNKIALTYQIEDVKKYHYSKIRIEDYIEQIRLNNEVIDKELLINELNKIGIKYISIR